jgi:hypothetical protein
MAVYLFADNTSIQQVTVEAICHIYYSMGCTTRPKITKRERFRCRQLLDGGSNFACSFVTRPIKLTALFIASRHTSTLCYQDHKQLKNIKSLLLKRGGSHSFLEATGPVYSAEQHKLQKLVRHFSNC